MSWCSECLRVDILFKSIILRDSEAGMHKWPQAVESSTKFTVHVIWRYTCATFLCLLLLQLARSSRRRMLNYSTLLPPVCINGRILKTDHILNLAPYPPFEHACRLDSRVTFSLVIVFQSLASQCHWTMWVKFKFKPHDSLQMLGLSLSGWSTLQSSDLLSQCVKFVSESI